MRVFTVSQKLLDILRVVQSYVLKGDKQTRGQVMHSSTCVNARPAPPEFWALEQDVLHWQGQLWVPYAELPRLITDRPRCEDRRMGWAQRYPSDENAASKRGINRCPTIASRPRPLLHQARKLLDDAKRPFRRPNGIVA